jgi:hypothetical protein
MRERPDDVDEAVRALYSKIPPMDERSFQTGREWVRTLVESEPLASVTVLDPVTTPTRPRRSRTAPFVTAAAAIAIVAGTITLLPSSAPDGSDKVTAGPNESLPPMPSKPLNSIGELADKVTDPQVNPDMYWYQDIDKTAEGMHDTRWTSFDGLRQWYTPSGNSPSEVDNSMPTSEVCVLVDRDMLCGKWLSFAPDASALATMPSDPATIYAGLRARLAQSGGPRLTDLTGPDGAAKVLLGLLTQPPVVLRAEQRAAVLRTLGYLPGLTVTESFTWGSVQKAIAISASTDSGLVQETLLDPTNSRILETRRSVDPQKRVFNVETYRTGVVRAVGLRPS